MSGKLSVHARGQVFVKKVVVPKGEPGNFLSDAELSAKFADLAQPVLGAVQTAKLAAAILDIDRLQNVSKLFDSAGRPREGEGPRYGDAMTTSEDYAEIRQAVRSSVRGVSGRIFPQDRRRERLSRGIRQCLDQGRVAGRAHSPGVRRLGAEL